MSIIEEQNKKICVELFENLKFSIKQRDTAITKMHEYIEKLKNNEFYEVIFTLAEKQYIDCLISQCNASDNISCSIEKTIE